MTPTVPYRFLGILNPRDRVLPFHYCFHTSIP